MIRTAAIFFLATLLSNGAFAMQPIDQAVAAVGDEVVTFYDIRSTWVSMGSPSDVDFKRILDQKITDSMINQETARLGISVTEREIDQAVGDVLVAQQMNQETLKQQLELAGTTLEAYRDSISDQLKQVKVVNQRIRANIAVSESELAENYERYKMEIGKQSIADARIILLPFKGDEAKKRVQKNAEDLYLEIEGGANFAILAEKHTRGPGGDNGGLVVEIKTGTLQPALDKVIFSLNPGESSKPILGQGAWFLVQLVHKNEDYAKSLEEIRPELMDLIYKRKFNDLFTVWVDDLRDSTAIRVLVEGNPPLGSF